MALLAWCWLAWAAGDVVYVDARASGAGDGSSWADAFNELQDALAVATGPIWIAQGVYTPENHFDVQTGQQLLGGFDGTERHAGEADPTQHLTVLSGDLGRDDLSVSTGITESVVDLVGSNAEVVLRLDGATDVLIEGLVITGGDATASGGGIWLSDAELTLRNVRMVGHRAATHGAAVYAARSEISMDRVRIANSEAGVAGAALFLDDGTFYAESVDVLDNRVTSTTPGAQVGGAIFLRGDGDLVDTTVQGNTSAQRAGGIVVDGQLALERVLLVANSGSDDAGGISVDAGGRLRAINTVVAGNDGTGIGGEQFSLELHHSTVAYNLTTARTTTYAGGIALAVGEASQTVEIANSIVWGNWQADGSPGPQIGLRNDAIAAGFSAEVRDSLVGESGGSGDWAVDHATDAGGNMDIDPLFAEAIKLAAVPASPRVLLRPNSPAIDSGNAASSPSLLTDHRGRERTYGEAPDLGAYESPFRCPSTTSVSLFVAPVGQGHRDGSSWQNAVGNPQDALAMLLDCPFEGSPPVWVAAGTYTPDAGGYETLGDTGASFELSPQARLFGGFAGTESSVDDRDTTANVTVLSGALDDGTASERVVYILNGSEIAELNGVFVSGGQTDSEGAGLVISGGQPLIQDVTVQENTAESGGGVLLDDTDAHLDRVTIANNLAQLGGGGVLIRGGGPTLENTVLYGNSASEGGAITAVGGHPVLRHLTVVENAATGEVGEGGGLLVAGEASVALANSVFWNNHAVVASTSGASLPAGSIEATFNWLEGSGGSDGWNGGFGTDGGGNLDGDPMLTQAPFRPASGSPLIDAGSVAETISELDRDGNARILDGNGDGDTAPDMGAYEAPYVAPDGDLGCACASGGTRGAWMLLFLPAALAHRQRGVKFKD